MVSGADADGLLLRIVTDDHLIWGTKRFDRALVEGDAEGAQRYCGSTILQIRKIKIVSHKITYF